MRVEKESNKKREAKRGGYHLWADSKLVLKSVGVVTTGGILRYSLHVCSLLKQKPTFNPLMAGVANLQICFPVTKT